MAILIASIIAIIQILAFTASPNCVYGRNHGPDADEIVWAKNICQGNERYAEVNFYVQDRLAGPNVSVYEVARATITSNSATGFGQVRVLDNLFTAEPDINSQALGQAQGHITSSDLETTALTMNLNFYFTAGQYNGSTISILGRNQILNAERELAVVGGTGVFRMARGYAISTTYSYDVEAEYGILEYMLYVCYMKPSKVIQMHCPDTSSTQNDTNDLFPKCKQARFF